MNKVFISPEAGRDLSEIRRYIAIELKNPVAARKTVHEILENINLLPFTGTRVEVGPAIQDEKFFFPIV